MIYNSPFAIERDIDLKGAGVLSVYISCDGWINLRLPRWGSPQFTEHEVCKHFGIEWTDLWHLDAEGWIRRGQLLKTNFDYNKAAMDRFLSYRTITVQQE